MNLFENSPQRRELIWWFTRQKKSIIKKAIDKIVIKLRGKETAEICPSN
jgi:hypothetical protein